ncbi:hypothetical protein [Streptomyces sp. NPDC048639]
MMITGHPAHRGAARTCAAGPAEPDAGAADLLAAAPPAAVFTPVAS